VIVWWVLPTSKIASAQEFPIDPGLNKPLIVHRPYKDEFTPPPKPQPPVKSKNTIRNVPGVSSGRDCSCVLFVKSKTGFSRSIGYARNWPKNTTAPQVGGVVITNESRAGHVAYITGLNSESIEVIEANYVKCKVSTRTIPLNSKIIMGFWNP
jgi:hypothetical protein